MLIVGILLGFILLIIVVLILGGRAQRKQNKIIEKRNKEAQKVAKKEMKDRKKEDRKAEDEYVDILNDVEEEEENFERVLETEPEENFERVLETEPEEENFEGVLETKPEEVVKMEEDDSVPSKDIEFLFNEDELYETEIKEEANKIEEKKEVEELEDLNWLEESKEDIAQLNNVEETNKLNDTERNENTNQLNNIEDSEDTNKLNSTQETSTVEHFEDPLDRYIKEAQENDIGYLNGNEAELEEIRIHKRSARNKKAGPKRMAPKSSKRKKEEK